MYDSDCLHALVLCECSSTCVCVCMCVCVHSSVSRGVNVHERVCCVEEKAASGAL